MILRCRVYSIVNVLDPSSVYGIIFIMGTSFDVMFNIISTVARNTQVHVLNYNDDSLTWNVFEPLSITVLQFANVMFSETNR